ncbi:type IV pilin N-terminal domain-containing protein [Methanolacinia paynteri]|uniref:type IV pilin N-terminal domain-containing protein n=1 Tax=Methanolacinia paynteri TaxID=230356 RepID=UPI0006947EC4|nr:type IV pilin N-terminal domain-containing protein [Methanolacinia paynteri]
MEFKSDNNAVSPVVGVMMMLVVTIIIAAVVSAFAGSSMDNQQKAPQATIQGKFSIGTGMEIIHMGGDALATNDLVFTVRNSPVFGPNLEQATSQIIDKKLITDGRERPLDCGDGSTDVTSFKSGDTLYISSSNIRCDLLQPILVPEDYSDSDNIRSDGYSYNSTGDYQNRWNLCFKNNENIGNTFYLDISDKSGNLICRSEVTITA